MILRAPSQILSHRRRYGEIIRVLSRYGIGSIVEQLGLRSLIPVNRGVFKRSPNGVTVSQAEHLRMALEDLGTTFIKLGQILSTREDLLPPAYIAELSKLRDQVPPVPTAEVRQVIESSFGKSIEELYASFDDEPLAAASIGQVHAATLHNGQRVIVKVQKPGIARQVEEDLAILHQIARFAQDHAPLADAYDLVALIDEFGWTLRSELDYNREGRNADQFRANFARSDDIIIPKVYWELTSSTVITEERIDGIKIDDIASIDAAGIDRKQLAQRSSRIIFRQVFDHRFYHADPHPGNYVVLLDGRIAVFDFGMVGRVDKVTHDALLSLAAGVVREDAGDVVDSLAMLGVVKHGTDRNGLRRDIQHLLDRYLGMTLEEYRFDVVINDVMAVIRRRQLQLPSEMSLLLKTLAMEEGVGRRIDPDLKPVEIAAPFIRRAIIEQWLPSTWIPELIASGEDLRRLLKYLPKRTERLLTRAEQGDIEIGIRVIHVEKIL
ncbi:MAG TPA: AarF/ABC1/UbiB kinase family protein, partial [Nitrolancea sp.]|nr:AarF/ABC1/UbiB kinase family protein [Nitrolancea sp.]